MATRRHLRTVHYVRYSIQKEGFTMCIQCSFIPPYIRNFNECWRFYSSIGFCEPCWGLFLRVRVHGMEWTFPIVKVRCLDVVRTY